MARLHAWQRTAAVLAASAFCIPLTTGPASAEILEEGTFHDTYGPEISFCGAPFEQQGVTDGRYQVVARGPNGQAYLLDSETYIETWTNTKTGELVTVEGHFVAADHEITFDEDGTMTDVIQVAGPYVMYNEEGAVLGRRAGVLRFELVFDADGNFVSRSDLIDAGLDFDFCATIEAAIG
jgi:hypothetical protein